MYSIASSRVNPRLYFNHKSKAVIKKNPQEVPEEIDDSTMELLSGFHNYKPT